MDKMKGAIYLPCGHEDEVLPHGIPLYMKDQDKEGAPTLVYTQYCRECFKKILDDEEWLQDIFFDAHDAECWFQEASDEYRKDKTARYIREAEYLEERAKELRSKYGT